MIYLYWAEEYEEESAVAHVRRVLDIFACTSIFGGPAANKGEDGKDEGGAQDKARKSSSLSSSTTTDEEGEISGACPTVGTFYDFFSLSHLTPPLQCEALHPHPSSPFIFFSWPTA